MLYALEIVSPFSCPRKIDLWWCSENNADAKDDSIFSTILPVLSYNRYLLNTATY